LPKGSPLLLTASAIAASSLAIDPLAGVTSAGLFPAIGIALSSRTNRSTRSSGDAQRARIAAFISEHEGAHLGGIVRKLDLGNHQATLHLSVLEAEGEIWSRRDGRLLRFYSKDISKLTPIAELPTPPLVHAPDSIQIRLLDRLARVPSADRESGPLSQGELAREIGCSQQLISYHLKQLAGEGLVRSERVGVRKRWRVSPIGLSVLQTGLEALPDGVNSETSEDSETQEKSEDSPYTSISRSNDD
jgi:predicted transcriptional regulator